MKTRTSPFIAALIATCALSAPSQGLEIRSVMSIENLAVFGSEDVSLFSGGAAYVSGAVPSGTVGNNFIFAGDSSTSLFPILHFYTQQSLTGNISVTGNGEIHGTNGLNISGLISGPTTGQLRLANAAIMANSPFLGTVHIGSAYSSVSTLTLAPGSGLPNARIKLTSGSGTTLAGSGTVGPIDIQGVRGYISPGGNGGIGALTIGDFRDITTGAGGIAGAHFTLDIGATADQIVLNGTMSLIGGAYLQLDLAPGFAPAVGDILYLIKNDGVDVFSDINTGAPTSFFGFPEGRLFPFGGTYLQTTYLADSATGSFTGGNDFAVKVVPEPSLGCLLVIGLGTTLLRRRQRRGTA